MDDGLLDAEVKVEDEKGIKLEPRDQGVKEESKDEVKLECKEEDYVKDECKSEDDDGNHVKDEQWSQMKKEC